MLWARVTGGNAMYQMLKRLLAVWVFCLLGVQGIAQSVDDGRLRVLVKPIPPFVIENTDGSLSGFSIDLWQMVEKQLGVQSDMTVLPNVTELLQAIETGKGDVAVAAVTITADREQRMDFSHPFFRSGLQILVPSDDMGMVAKALSVIKGMFSSQSFRFALLALAILVLGTAHIMWLVERRKNPEFTRGYPMGLWDGVYWTMVTISTVGYGDKTPKSHPGKVIALVLIVFGYVAFAWFTATISSAMTVSRLEGEIRGPEDLGGKRVATVSGSTSEAYLQHLPAVQIRAVETIDQAYQALEAGQVAAVVYDFPVLSHYANGEGQDKVRLTGPVFQREPYGIVFPEGSKWRERVNQALLQLSEQGDFDRIYLKWFGRAPN